MDGNGNLYAGGGFTLAGGVNVNANHIARWEGSSWSALGSGTDDHVYALAVDSSGDLYAGGEFTTAGGKPSSYIARWSWFRVYLPLVQRVGESASQRSGEAANP